MTKIILTGAMGAGKSSVLNELEKKYRIIHEPARGILAEQKLIKGRGLPEKDSRLFTELMLSRAQFQYHQAEWKHATFFDRSMVDLIAYAELFEHDMPHIRNACKHYCYEVKAFFFPAWEEIYCTDNERRMSFGESRHFGERLKYFYEEHGYQLIEVPKASIKARVDFIIDYMGE